MARPERPVDPDNGRPVAFDHLPAKRARRQLVDIVFDEDAAEAYAELVQKLEVARAQRDAAVRIADDPERIVSLTADHDALEAEAEAEAVRLLAEKAVVRFTFQSIGARPYDDLINEHPPTEEQIQKSRDDGTPRPGWNTDTFVPTLIATCCVDPIMSVDQVQAMFKSSEWNDAELNQLSAAAVLVNMRATGVDLKKGSGRTTSTARS